MEQTITPGQRLEAVRALYGFTKKEFIDLLQTAVHTYDAVKTNNKKISLDYAEILQEKFGINPTWLFFGEGYMHEKKVTK